MLGLMQDHPLLISTLIEFADRHHGTTAVVSKMIEGPTTSSPRGVYRYTYAEAHRRAKQLGAALSALGVRTGDRVGTLAWNTHRHFELYFAVSGVGAVLHTLNPRLFPDQIAWIANHAEDSFLFFDLTFLPLVERLAPALPHVRQFIVLTDHDHLPATAAIPGLACYEDLIHAQDARTFVWPRFDEHTASSLCYTSGTTGDPKGALYSHRSTVLQAYASALPDSLGLSARDRILPVVPMFHANAWSLVYSAPLVGASLVLPGKDLDGRSLYDLIEQERVTWAAGVPTVWLGLLAHCREHKLRFSSLRRTLVGGSACPPAMIREFHERHGIEAVHAWGMTEMSPLGTVCTLKAKHLDLPPDDQFRVQVKQGRSVYGVDMNIVDDHGDDLPWDGKAFGHLVVRGPWVVRQYYKAGDGPLRSDGWFPTGDVATIDADGYMQITDRSKDVIKSGGEWISSIDIENLALAHPAVAEAACIGVAHPTWDERPLLVVVSKAGADVTRAELLAFFTGKVANWWIPDDVQFVEELPHTATGKIHKTTLREQFAGFVFPERASERRR